MKKLLAIGFAVVTLSSAFASVTPPEGACSSASATVNLVVKNRGFDETAKKIDTRSFFGFWSNLLELFDTTPTGLFIVVQ